MAKFEIDKISEYIYFMDKEDEPSRNEYFNTLKKLMDEWIFTKNWVLFWASKQQFDKRVTIYMLEQIDRKIPHNIEWKPFGIKDARSGDYRVWMIMQVVMDEKAPKDLDIVKNLREKIENNEIEGIVW